MQYLILPYFYEKLYTTNNKKGYKHIVHNKPADTRAD